MKIFISGQKQPYAYETFCAEEFRRVGCNVLHWDCKPVTPLSLLKKLPGEFSRLGGEFYNFERSLAFIRAVKSFRPDVLFILKSENIHSRAIKIALKETGARLVIWYPDNPFWANQTNMNVIRNLQRCDRFYTWGRFLIDTLYSAGCRQVDYLPFGYYPDYFKSRIEPTHKNADCEYNISFVGTWDPTRERALIPLSHFGLSIWGPGWLENLPSDSPLRLTLRGNGLYGTDMARVYRSSKLVFNHLRRHNGDAHNMRTMEIAGIGAVQLVRWTTDHSRILFKHGEHLLCFHDQSDLIRTVRGLLANATNQLTEMGKSARKHVLKYHLLSHRINTIITDIQ